MILTGVIQLLLLRINVQAYLNLGVLAWYESLHGSKTPDAAALKHKILVVNHFMCRVAIQNLVPAVLLILFAGLSRSPSPSSNAPGGIGFVAQTAQFFAWWTLLSWSLLTPTGLATTSVQLPSPHSRIQKIGRRKTHTGTAWLTEFSWPTAAHRVPGRVLPKKESPMRVAAPPLPGSEAGPEARLRILGSFRDEILESLIALPDLTALRDFYFQPFPDFAYDILNNVLAQGREKTFHYIYDALIAEPSFWRALKPDSVFAFGHGYVLFKGEEEGEETEGNPAEELVNKDGWPYGDSIPYIPAYYARAFVVTFCALYQENGVTYRLTLDIRTAEGRLGVFMAFLKVAQLVHKLEAI
ncbi:hypothetical protein SELMODRAFT_420900 [Selaginella moellendorffii]|uniref:Uncharacterized protein n=1 Tax=Selaginella moellendorffii TaxID=88036 RepID=D8SDH2_SELML|nr:hypothetical protein SELMODRAFT_420900 [Selaginella moellendorffii]